MGSKRTNSKSWSSDLIERLCALKRAGSRNADIARALGITSGSVAGQIFRMRQDGDPRLPAAEPDAIAPTLKPVDRVAEAMSDGAGSVAEAARQAKLTIGQAQYLWAKICTGFGSQAA